MYKQSIHKSTLAFKVLQHCRSIIKSLSLIIESTFNHCLKCYWVPGAAQPVQSFCACAAWCSSACAPASEPRPRACTHDGKTIAPEKHTAEARGGKGKCGEHTGKHAPGKPSQRKNTPRRRTGWENSPSTPLTSVKTVSAPGNPSPRPPPGLPRTTGAPHVAKCEGRRCSSAWRHRNNLLGRAERWSSASRGQGRRSPSRSSDWHRRCFSAWRKSAAPLGRGRSSD